jgi:acetate kinase
MRTDAENINYYNKKMSGKYLIVNTGSASKKYAVYEKDTEIAFVHLETEENKYISTIRLKDKIDTESISRNNFEQSLEYLVEILKSRNIISGKDDIHSIGIRVVAPGIYFQSNKIIDETYLKNLKVALQKAPLHLEVVFEEIKKLKKFFGKDKKIVGVSDSEFHFSMPQMAKNYAIYTEDAEKHEIYRYGYHGISAQSIINKLNKRGDLPSRIIVCHIGGGVSIMAVKNGKSIDTSMGFTPLEGAVMANRVGDIDSGAIVYLSEVLHLKGLKLLQYLNKKCGLYGLSNGLSNDIRDLFKAEEDHGDFRASNALDTYVYKIKKQIGGCFVVLGGLDMVVFTGTVGERSYKMRKRICRGLESLGIVIDDSLNENIDGVDGILGHKDSKVKIEVIKTDEMKQIAIETQKII